MNEKEAIERLKQDENKIEGLCEDIEKSRKEAIETVLNLIEKQDKIINEMKKENHDLKEKLQMFIPRRRVRRVYKMLGKILSVDIDPIILEKELKAEYKIKEDK